MADLERRAILGIRVFLFIFGIALFVYAVRNPSTAPPPKLRPANEGHPITSPDDTGAEVSILTNLRNVELYSRCWGKKVDPRGIVVMIHGLSWHSQYFQEFAGELANEGLKACAVDLTGHGRSGDRDGARGYIHSLEEFANDADMLILQQYQQHPGVPLFVYAESMGAAAALRLMRRTPLEEVVKGYILSGTVVRIVAPHRPPAWDVMLLRTFNFFAPKLSISNHEIISTWKEAFGDQEVAEKSLQDPLVLTGRIRAATAVAILTGTEENWRRLRDIKAPYLALHGNEDVRADKQFAEELYKWTSSTDKTLKVYDGMKHQLLQETAENKAQVFQDILEWLAPRLLPAPEAAPNAEAAGGEERKESSEMRQDQSSGEPAVSES